MHSNNNVIQNFSEFKDSLISKIRNIYKAGEEDEEYDLLSSQLLGKSRYRKIIDLCVNNKNVISNDFDNAIKSIHNYIFDNQELLKTKHIYIYYEVVDSDEFKLYLPKIIISKKNMLDDHMNNPIDQVSLASFMKKFEKSKTFHPISRKWGNFLVNLLFHFFHHHKTLYHYSLEDETSKLIQQIGLRSNINTNY